MRRKILYIMQVRIVLMLSIHFQKETYKISILINNSKIYSEFQLCALKDYLLLAVDKEKLNGR